MLARALALVEAGLRLDMLKRGAITALPSRLEAVRFITALIRLRNVFF